jgi:hypothetical protein
MGIFFDEYGNGFSKGILRKVKILGFAETEIGQAEPPNTEDVGIVLLIGGEKKPFHFLVGYGEGTTYDAARQDALQNAADVIEQLLMRIRMEIVRIP